MAGIENVLQLDVKVGSLNMGRAPRWRHTVEIGIDNEAAKELKSTWESLGWAHLDTLILPAGDRRG